MILIVGAKGQLGSWLAKLLPKALATDVDTLDITDAQAVNEFVDKHGVQTIINCAAYTADLAVAIVHVLPKIQPSTKEICHYSNEGVCSWYDFASFIMQAANLPCAVCPIPTIEYPTPAARPTYSVLDKSKIKQHFGLAIPHWHSSLLACINNIQASHD